MMRNRLKPKHYWVFRRMVNLEANLKKNAVMAEFFKKYRKYLV